MIKNDAEELFASYGLSVIKRFRRHTYPHRVVAFRVNPPQGEAFSVQTKKKTPDDVIKQLAQRGISPPNGLTGPT